eukprot:3081565-Rhodomonas_salina.1
MSSSSTSSSCPIFHRAQPSHLRQELSKTWDSHHANTTLNLASHIMTAHIQSHNPSTADAPPPHPPSIHCANHPQLLRQPPSGPPFLPLPLRSPPPPPPVPAQVTSDRQRALGGERMRQEKSMEKKEREERRE